MSGVWDEGLSPMNLQYHPFLMFSVVIHWEDVHHRSAVRWEGDEVNAKNMKTTMRSSEQLLLFALN